MLNRIKMGIEELIEYFSSLLMILGVICLLFIPLFIWSFVNAYVYAFVFNRFFHVM